MTIEKALQTLGIAETTSEIEIRKAYRRLSLQWHPAKNDNSAESQTKSQEIQAAYELLIEADRAKGIEDTSKLIKYEINFGFSPDEIKNFKQEEIKDLDNSILGVIKEVEAAIGRSVQNKIGTIQILECSTSQQRKTFENWLNHLYLMYGLGQKKNDEEVDNWLKNDIEESIKLVGSKWVNWNRARTRFTIFFSDDQWAEYLAKLKNEVTNTLEIEIWEIEVARKVLGVTKEASSEDIKRIYKKLSGKNHPDKGGDKKIFQAINEAYKFLGEKNLSELDQRKHDLCLLWDDESGSYTNQNKFQELQTTNELADENFRQQIKVILETELENSNLVQEDIVKYGTSWSRHEWFKSTHMSIQVFCNNNWNSAEKGILLGIEKYRAIQATRNYLNIIEDAGKRKENPWKTIREAGWTYLIDKWKNKLLIGEQENELETAIRRTQTKIDEIEKETKEGKIPLTPNLKNHIQDLENRIKEWREEDHKEKEAKRERGEPVIPKIKEEEIDTTEQEIIAEAGRHTAQIVRGEILDVSVDGIASNAEKNAAREIGERFSDLQEGKKKLWTEINQKIKTGKGLKESFSLEDESKKAEVVNFLDDFNRLLTDLNQPSYEIEIKEGTGMKEVILNQVTLDEVLKTYRDEMEELKRNLTELTEEVEAEEEPEAEIPETSAPLSENEPISEADKQAIIEYLDDLVFVIAPKNNKIKSKANLKHIKERIIGIELDWERPIENADNWRKVEDIRERTIKNICGIIKGGGGSDDVSDLKVKNILTGLAVILAKEISEKLGTELSPEQKKQLEIDWGGGY